MSARILERLNRHLAARVPGAALVKTSLPQVPQISLWLLPGDYPQDRLSDEQAIALMDAPPYWSFCWASGQVLAREILNNPQWVKGNRVVDFGAGSGVVAIAAALAGADTVIAVDSDPLALQVCTLNAELNGVSLQTFASIESIADGSEPASAESTVCIADVFYDRDNVPLLDAFNRSFEQRLVADSRLGGGPLPGVEWIAQFDSSTVPDLNESADFNRVSVYRGLGDWGSVEDARSGAASQNG